MKKYKNLIISICSRDVRYVLSVYDPNHSLIITSSRSLLNTYKLLNLNVTFSKNVFIIYFSNLGSSLFFFGQGNRFDLVILALLKKVLPNFLSMKIFYKDCYVDHFDKIFAKRDEILWVKFQKFTYFLTGIVICGVPNRYSLNKNHIVYKFVWVNLYQDNILLNYEKYKIDLDKNSIILLLDPGILDLVDIEILAKYYTLYLKPHYLDDYGINILSQIEGKAFLLDRNIPCELFQGYKYIIGFNSTCLMGLDNSISLAPLIGAETNGKVGQSFNTMATFYQFIISKDV
jgi:hypothetical protein